MQPLQTSERAASPLPLRPLIANTLAFALAFAAWVVLGPASRLIAKELGLDPGTGALVKALPILTGSLLRIPVGMLTDRLGARRVFPALLVSAGAGALFLAQASTVAQVLVGGLVLGFAGTTFVVGVQSVSAWTPRERQGLALGCFGAGNVGTALTTFGFPLLAVALGWRSTLIVYAAVLLGGAVLYALAVRDVPRTACASLATLLAPLAAAGAWLLGAYYVATFGVFVATTLLVTDLYVDAWGLSLAAAGMVATTFTFTASLARIPGGALADRFGARVVLGYSIPVVACALVPVSMGPPLVVAAVFLLVAGLALGAGMAATFKAIPERFPDQVGAVGGIVGALGGLGGFLLPLAGIWARQVLGSPFAVFVPLAATCCLAGLILVIDERRRGAQVAAPVAPAAVGSAS